MNILVTGGAGFIGSNLVGKLIGGNNVTVLDNFSSGYSENLAPFPSVRIIAGDVRDYNTVELAMRGAEVVFHLAASVGNKRSIENPFQDAEINALGTLNILEAACKEGVKKIVVSSSAGIFGELKTLPIGEDHPCEPDSPYGCSKLYEEKIALTYGKLYDLKVVCLRYFNVYGPNQRFDEYGNVIPIFVFRMIQNKPLIIYGDGEQTRDFVHVDDVVQANIKAANSEATGVFNIASGERVTINQLARWISNDIEYDKERPGDVRDSLADITKAKGFGYEPTVDLQTGVKEYIKWVSNDT
jgi:nucleoside-diphosphate-sugar epimerase